VGAVHSIKSGKTLPEKVFSALPLIADIRLGSPQFRLVPEADIAWHQLDPLR
jgi:hypothetical protein